MKRILVAFDFDHTLIDDNSDTYIRRLAPNGGQIPAHITKLYSESGWTKYMDAVFEYLHDNGVTASQLLSCVAEIPLIDGMKELLEHIRQRSTCKLPPQVQAQKGQTSKAAAAVSRAVEYEAIVISDANSVGVRTGKFDFSQVFWCN